MIGPEQYNATATFLSLQKVGVKTDPFGDEVTEEEWVEVLTEDVFYNPRSAQYEMLSTGDTVVRGDTLLANTSVLESDVSKGDRVEVSTMGETYHWRITSIRKRQLGDHGYITIDVEDFGDEE